MKYIDELTPTGNNFNAHTIEQKPARIWGLSEAKLCKQNKIVPKASDVGFLCSKTTTVIYDDDDTSGEDGSKLIARVTGAAELIRTKTMEERWFPTFVY